MSRQWAQYGGGQTPWTPFLMFSCVYVSPADIIIIDPMHSVHMKCMLLNMRDVLWDGFVYLKDFDFDSNIIQMGFVISLCILIIFLID